MATTTVPRNRFKEILGSIHIPPVYIFLVVIFVLGGTLDQLFSDGQMFTNPAISINIIVRSVALGIVAVGQTLVIIGASIDLSVAYVVSITAVMCSYIMQGDPNNIPKAIIVVLAIGTVIGLVNGLIITKLRVNSFIATLGTSLIIKGIINATFANYTGSVPRSFEYFGYGMLGPNSGVHHRSTACGYSRVAAVVEDKVRFSFVRRRRQQRGLPAFRPENRPGDHHGAHYLQPDRCLDRLVCGQPVEVRSSLGWAGWALRPGIDRHDRGGRHGPLRWERRGVGHACRGFDLRGSGYHVQPVGSEPLSKNSPSRRNYRFSRCELYIPLEKRSRIRSGSNGNRYNYFSNWNYQSPPQHLGVDPQDPACLSGISGYLYRRGDAEPQLPDDERDDVLPAPGFAAGHPGDWRDDGFGHRWF